MRVLWNKSSCWKICLGKICSWHLKEVFPEDRHSSQQKTKSCQAWRQHAAHAFRAFWILSRKSDHAYKERQLNILTTSPPPLMPSVAETEEPSSLFVKCMTIVSLKDPHGWSQNSVCLLLKASAGKEWEPDTDDLASRFIFMQVFRDRRGLKGNLLRLDKSCRSPAPHVTCLRYKPCALCYNSCLTRQ